MKNKYYITWMCLSMIFCMSVVPFVYDVHAESFENPIAYSTVDSLLSNILRTVQGIVAVLAVLMIVVGGVMYITSAGGAQVDLAKKTITSALIGLAIALAAPTFLQEIYSILGGTGGSAIPAGTKTLSQIVISTIRVLTGIIGSLSVLMLVVGGIMYITSAGTDRTDTARKIITSAIIGLIIAILSLVIVNFVIGVF